MLLIADDDNQGDPTDRELGFVLADSGTRQADNFIPSDAPDDASQRWIAAISGDGMLLLRDSGGN